MATAAHSILAPAVQTADCINAPTPANDTAPCWTSDRRARAILATVAAHPPHGEWHRPRFGNTVDEYWTYVGYRFDCLTAIRDAYGQKALEHYHATGNFAVFGAYCDAPNVNDAIEAAREAGREG